MTHPASGDNDGPDDDDGGGVENDHDDELICLLGWQNSVMSGQGRQGTMAITDTAAEGGRCTTRAA